jgi:hypothetical protein
MVCIWQVMLQVMYQMYRIASDWAWHGVLESYTNLLKFLLTLDDGLHEARIHESISGNYGLLTIILQKTQASSRVGMHHQDRQLIQKYTEIGQELYQLPVVKEWFEARADSDDQDLQWFRRSLAPEPRK